MPYKISPSYRPVDSSTHYRNIWDPITCDVVTVYVVLLARFPYVSRHTGFCYLTRIWEGEGTLYLGPGVGMTSFER
jgi:hypothetical protein